MPGFRFPYRGQRDLIKDSPNSTAVPAPLEVMICPSCNDGLILAKIGELVRGGSMGSAGGVWRNHIRHREEEEGRRRWHQWVCQISQKAFMKSMISVRLRSSKTRATGEYE